jgi:hypothetical protein
MSDERQSELSWFGLCRAHPLKCVAGTTNHGEGRGPTSFLPRNLASTYPIRLQSMYRGCFSLGQVAKTSNISGMIVHTSTVTTSLMERLLTSWEQSLCSRDRLAFGYRVQVRRGSVCREATKRAKTLLTWQGQNVARLIDVAETLHPPPDLTVMRQGSHFLHVQCRRHVWIRKNYDIATDPSHEVLK